MGGQGLGLKPDQYLLNDAAVASSVRSCARERIWVVSFNGTMQMMRKWT